MYMALARIFPVLQQLRYLLIFVDALWCSRVEIHEGQSDYLTWFSFQCVGFFFGNAGCRS